MSLLLNTSLFLSTHVNKIDGKGRVSFPASFRAALAARSSQGVVIFKSLHETALEGFTIERLHQMAQALEQLPPFSAQRTALETAIFANTQELAIDKEGRCSLPKDLAALVGITNNEVAFVGKGSTFQIWEPSAHAAALKSATDAVKSGDVEFPKLTGLV
ncbi:division/cell wall cluster transcriptional repressor MraZ [Roseiterribacter gracilis]|uniref:Transcriptional regulator MraZ n=1 Tax=Roseiterribacter gracilis TaxID=2812848 RepID=A0A8S8X8I1_9PROT|nr:transcriptional regulator MraZ [Rhodospirillales bacterium TMPK1]